VNQLLKIGGKAFLWSVIYIFLLLSLFTPFNFITINLMMVPVLILYMKLDIRRFILIYISCLFVLFLITFGYGIAFVGLSLFFLPPVIVMGRLYKKGSSALAAIAFGTLAMLAELVSFLFVSYAAGINPIKKFELLYQESVKSLPEALRNSVPPEYMDMAIHYFTLMLPLFMVSFSLYYVIITHIIARWRLRKMGEAVPALPSIREWMMPKSIAWYYVILSILQFFVDFKVDSILLMVLFNLLPFVTIALVLQAVAFLFFVTHAKRWSKALPIIVVVLLILLAPFGPSILYLFSLLGLLDIMFSLRQRIATKL
jgi:uncharacterized protein YybS (DUF2232 family)